jgi:YetA-like protein
MLSCPLFFHTLEPCPRRGEPVTVGLPWPRGAVKDDRCLRLIGPDGTEQVLQTKVLDRWPDGSVRWCLFDFLATWDGKFSGEAQSSEPSAASGYRVEVRNETSNHPSDAIGQSPRRFRYASNVQSIRIADMEADVVEQDGPIRRVWKMRDESVGPLILSGHWEEFAANSTARIRMTIRNPQPADHPGGNWDLGNGGSVTFPYLNVYFDIDDTKRKITLRLSPDRNEPWEIANRELTLHQHSSGGNNWKSSNHVDRTRSIPLAQRGYLLESDDRTETGSRSTPIVTLEYDDGMIGVAMPHFWENFPKRIYAVRNSITLQLFHGETELQGGEQKMHTFYISHGRDTITDDPMVWCRSPTVALASPEWYANSGAIPYLTPKATDPHAAYLALVDQAIEGPDTFIHKREKIDEYGWRNFGDIYGDHEAVYHKGETPLISHYNNQYDCVAGFFYQFFRSGDLRWLTQGLECADHTCDIDIYHTDGDKAAYNRGLFWHTYHYADADTGTHRAYPKSLTRGPVESLTQKMDELGETAKQLKKSYAVGGGPSASHNYNAGLMLAYFLTGNPLYRDSALDLANFVINMEDPSKTPFRFLSREFTGLATESGGGGYHGPGRAAANSILALLVGHRLTGARKYLDKAEQLIRRVVHPQQNLESLDLLNAELRWFYTMTLQALGEYLDYKIELDEPDEHYAYARLTLLHYARWMAKHERPILDTLDKLQYPTETWAAQDMRKVEVFQFAAKHATGEERAKYLERAEWFFNYVQNKLHEFETKSLCRPVILMMRYGWSRNWWRLNSDSTAPFPRGKISADDFGTWRMFTPQKAKAIRRAKSIAVVVGICSLIAMAALVMYLLNS